MSYFTILLARTFLTNPSFSAFIFAVDNSGELDSSEVRALLALAGFDESVVDDDLFELFSNELDENGDGHVTYIEFSRAIESRKKGNGVVQTQPTLGRKQTFRSRSSAASHNEIKLQALLHNHEDDLNKKEDVSLAHKQRHMKKLEVKKAARKSSTTIVTSSGDELDTAEQQPQQALNVRASRRMSITTVKLEVNNLKRDAAKSHREREFASHHAKTEADGVLKAKLQARSSRMKDKVNSVVAFKAAGASAQAKNGE